MHLADQLDALVLTPRASAPIAYRLDDDGHGVYAFCGEGRLVVVDCNSRTLIKPERLSGDWNRLCSAVEAYGLMDNDDATKLRTWMARESPKRAHRLEVEAAAAVAKRLGYRLVPA